MTASSPPHPPFAGIEGRVLATLLQLPFVRRHRIQAGVVQAPSEYTRFLAEVVAERLARVPRPLGVFGVGRHTEMLLDAAPTLAPRIHCFTDNNEALWNTERFGRPVFAPQYAVTRCETFFLSTPAFQKVLRADLKRLGFTGTIVTADDIVPPAWFLS